MRTLKRFSIALAIYFIILFAVAGFLVGMFHPNPPKALPSVTEPFATMDISGMPAVQSYCARDGAMLSYRVYRGTNEKVVVLIHGSAGSSQDMHQLAKALQQAGSTVLVPDLRGHGGNWPHGDIAYIGQLDDDMQDFDRTLKPAYPGKKWTLVGFSSGGGFALRIAGSNLGTDFDRFILLSPFLRYNAPTERPKSSQPSDDAQWYSVSIARIVGLSIFDFFGIHHFDGLPVLSFPVPSNIESATSTYSFRMQKNFEPHADYKADISRTPRPMEVLVGGSDELFLPEQFAKIFDAKRHDIPVTILPGMTHTDMITKPLAIQAVVQAVESDR